MRVDRTEIRRRLVDGWKPRQHVEIEVAVLRTLLDELDELHSERSGSFALPRCSVCGVKCPTGFICGAWVRCMRCHDALDTSESPREDDVEPA